jgi:lysophospholipase L1-like esterase
VLVAIGLAACGGGGGGGGNVPAVSDQPAFDGKEDNVVDNEDILIENEGIIIDNGSEDIIIDNGSTGTTAKGVWTFSGAPYPYGASSLYTKEVNASYTFEAAASGIHDLYMWWTQYSDRGVAIPVKIYDGGVLIDTVFVNQQLNGKRWNLLGTYDFSSAARIVIISQSTTCADAVRLVPITDVGPRVTLTFPARYHLQTSPDLVAMADARYLEAGWGVRFLIDAGVRSIDDYLPPYEAIFREVSRTEHTIDALVIDSQGREVAGAEAHRRVIQIGIGDYYVAMGDSITKGFGDDITSDNTSVDGRNLAGGYTPILNGHLTGTRKFPHHLVNEGVAGALSADGKAIAGILLAKHPDAQTFLVQYGTNDSPRVPSGRGLLPEDDGYRGSYKENMQQIIDAIHGDRKKVYLAKVPIALGEWSTGTPFTNPETALRNQIIREYNQVVEELVLANQIPVSPPDLYAYFAGVNPDTGKYRYQEEFADNVHPNGLGYRSMAELWKEAINLKAGTSSP